MTQAELGDAAGLSQGWISQMERGVAPSASLESWACVASVLDLQLVVFFEAVPGASQPRDLEHLRRQELLLRTASSGGWVGRPEAAVPIAGAAVRSVDVLLIRAATREAAVCEVWDLLLDVGDAFRGIDVKVDAIRNRLGPGWRVQGLWIVRATRRNRALLAEFAALFGARFAASGSLGEPSGAMPDAAGLIWSDSRQTRFFARRRTRPR